MSINLTVDQVMSMAPDPSSAKSGKDLANQRKWVSLGNTNDCAWGECQGSGSLPYQTRMDLADIAFKCSCPSRKFPCKHSLGLLLLLVQQPAAFANAEPPSWVKEWLETRRAKAEKKAQKAEEPPKPVDAEAQAKRLEQRKQKVFAGVIELDRWMQDLVRQGLGSSAAKPYSFWESIAARMVDCQAPGLARMLRDCAGISATGEGWQERLLERLGRLYLLVEATGRLADLPDDIQEEVKSNLGFTVNQDELLKQVGLTDTWDIVGQRTEQEDRLRVQRTWLYGRESRRWALVLSFAHGTAPLDSSLVSGSAVKAELVFFAGSFPIRALVKSREDHSIPMSEITAGNITDAFNDYSQALARNPWIEKFPMALTKVTPRYEGDDNWWLTDSSGNALQLSLPPMSGWDLIAISGGKPVSVFGEWDGSRLLPLMAAANNSLIRVC